jgi:hypothetical protein
MLRTDVPNESQWGLRGHLLPVWWKGDSCITRGALSIPEEITVPIENSVWKTVFKQLDIEQLPRRQHNAPIGFPPRARTKRSGVEPARPLQLRTPREDLTEVTGGLC